MIAILHLSDIHFDHDSNPVCHRLELIAQAFTNVLDSPSTCFIVVSGDIAFSGQSSEYAVATPFFASLRDSLMSHPSVQAAHFIFIPGNHDCNLQGSTSVRDFILDHYARNDTSSPDEDLLHTVISVQNDFFTFTSAFSDPPPAPSDRIYSETEYTISDTTVRFHLYNTAWASRLPELPGKMLFPTSIPASTDSASRPVDLIISVLHHPPNWLEPSTSRHLRTHLERTSDLILTGHEHVASRFTRFTDTGASVTHVEGAVLQDTDDDTNSAFHIIQLDVPARRQLTATYTWTGSCYEAPTPLAWADFAKNPLVAHQTLDNNDTWAEFLDDPGTPFTHPRRASLRLSDIFLYPDLFRRSLDALVSQRARWVRGPDVLDFVATHGTVIFTGPSSCGKTTLAKRLYFDLRQRKGATPLLVSGDSLQGLRKRKFLDAIYTEFRKQYTSHQAERYRQLDSSQRALLVDDFDRSRMSRPALKEFLDLAKTFADTILIFADELFVIERLTHSGEDRNDGLGAFEHCEIKEFGFRLRGTLIEQWHRLGYEGRELPSDFEHRVSTAEHLVTTLLGKNLLPSFPLTTLTILQITEASANPGTTSGSYGYLYEALITRALGKTSPTVAAVDTKYTYLSRLAYAFHSSDDVAGLSRERVDEVSEEYFRTYRMRFSVDQMLNELEEAGILMNVEENYAFKYKYVYSYFVGRHFRDRIASLNDASRARQELRGMAERLHVEDYANVLTFYLYLTKDVEVIQQVLEVARRVYSNHAPCDLDTDVTFVNKLYTDDAPLHLPPGDPAEHRTEDRARQDEVPPARETAVGRLEESEDELREVSYHDKLDDVLKVNFALKALHVMGQVLKNFPGSLPSQIKEELATESYLLGLRTLKAILRIAEANLGDLRTYLAMLIRERRRISDVSELGRTTDEAIIWMTLSCALGMTKRISSSVGLHELRGTFSDVLKNLGEPLSARLIDVSIKLDHFPGFPYEEIKAIAHDTTRNHFTKRVLRDLVVNHLYLFNVDYRIRQKLSRKLGIQGTDKQYIANPSKKVQ